MLLVSIETPEEDQAISDTWGLGNSPLAIIINDVTTEKIKNK